MKITQIMATTHLDRHNQRFSKESLEGLANQINESSALGVTIEHDLTLPFFGKVTNAYLKQLPDGEYGVFGESILFNQEETQEVTLPTGKKGIIDTWSDDKPFLIEKNEVPSSIEISFDLVNFKSNDDIKIFQDEVPKGLSFNSRTIVRKSFIPDPQLIINLSESAIQLLIAQKLLTTVGKKITDDISNDIANLYSMLRTMAIKYAKRCIPTNRPVTYIFVISKTPIIEFVVKTENPSIIAEATKKMSDHFDEAEQLHQLFDSQKTQFLFTENGTWEFNYLLTTSGKVVGSQDAISRREKAREVFLEQNKQ